MQFLKNAYNYISGMNFVTSLVCCLLLKALVADVSYATFLITVPILAHDAFKNFLKSKKPDPVVMDNEVRKELELLKGRLSGMNMEKNIPQAAKRYF